MSVRNLQVLDAAQQERQSDHLLMKLAEACPERYMKKMLEIANFDFKFAITAGLETAFIEALNAGKWETSSMGRFSPSGSTAFHSGAEYGRLAIVKAVMTKFKAELDGGVDAYSFAFSAACKGGFIEVASYIGKNAKILHKTSNILLAATSAIVAEKWETVRWLSQYLSEDKLRKVVSWLGACGTKCSYGLPELSLEQFKLVFLNLQITPAILAESGCGWTLLCYMIDRDCMEVAEWLIAAGYVGQLSKPTKRQHFAYDDDYTFAEFPCCIFLKKLVWWDRSKAEFVVKALGLTGEKVAQSGALMNAGIILSVFDFFEGPGKIKAACYLASRLIKFFGMTNGQVLRSGVLLAALKQSKLYLAAWLIGHFTFPAEDLEKAVAADDNAESQIEEPTQGGTLTLEAVENELLKIGVLSGRVACNGGATEIVVQKALGVIVRNLTFAKARSLADGTCTITRLCDRHLLQHVLSKAHLTPEQLSYIVDVATAIPDAAIIDKIIDKSAVCEADIAKILEFACKSNLPLMAQRLLEKHRKEAIDSGIVEIARHNAQIKQVLIDVYGAEVFASSTPL